MKEFLHWLERDSPEWVRHVVIVGSIAAAIIGASIWVVSLVGLIATYQYGLFFSVLAAPFAATALIVWHEYQNRDR